MNWADVLMGVGGAIATGIGGFVLGKHLRGKPPASREAWDKIEADAAAARARREAHARQQAITPSDRPPRP